MDVSNLWLATVSFLFLCILVDFLKYLLRNKADDISTMAQGNSSAQAQDSLTFDADDHKTHGKVVKDMNDGLGQVKVKRYTLKDNPGVTTSGPYSNPVYKQISLRNGEINKMNRAQLQQRCSAMKLDTRGVKEVLRKRLKNYYTQAKLRKAHIQPSNQKNSYYDYLLVIDFEATCREEAPSDYAHEIIEFPIILVNTSTLQIEDEFHAYCKPTLNPKLTEFCTWLTGITQATVSDSNEFPDVLHRVHTWMEKHGLDGSKGGRFAVVTDGPWDMSRFMYGQCRLSEIPYPAWCKKWVNIRKTFSNFYSCQRAKLSVMLENLGLSFEGREHSGIDDARNIAKIMIMILQDGCEIRTNERLRKPCMNEHDQMKADLDAEIEAIVRKDGDFSESDLEDNVIRVSPDHDLCDRMKDLNVKPKKDRTASKQTELIAEYLDQDNIDDLMNYFKLQSS